LTVVAHTTPEQFGLPLLVQWQKNGQNIAGATKSTLTLTNVASGDTGKYKAILNVAGVKSVDSTEVDVTVNPDTAPPKVVSAAATGLQSILLNFDETVEKTSAGTASNYTISDGVTVTSATPGESGVSVLLATSALTSDKQYTITLGGIKDPYNNTVPAGTTFQFVSKIVSYADIILADKPIAFYRFEETSGAVAKNSGSTGGDGAYYVGDEATPNEGGTPGAAKGDAGPRPPGFVGFASDNRAATFGGPDTMEWVDTKNKFLDHRSSFTIEYWVKPTARVGADPAWSRIGIVGQNDAIEYGFINGTTIQIWTPGGGSLDTTYTFADDEWHHVATIADGTNLKNYFDGKLAGTGGSATGDYGTSTYNVHIGGAGVFDVTGNYFKGQIDEVAIFDKAIPAERVAIHFQAGKDGYTPPDNGGSDLKFGAIVLANGQVTISWTGTGTLQEAAAITGPWAASPSQANPQTVAATGTKFYRLTQ
jgi:hypothetical protein